MSEILSVTKIPEPTVIVSGDFNFSFVEWIREENGGCRWEEKARSGATKERRKQFEKLIEEMDRFNLVQIIEEATRMKNTLDLIFTNEVAMITNVDVNKSNLSDHDLVELTTNIKTDKTQIKANINNENEKEQSFWDLNFHNEEIDWKLINNALRRVPWEIIFTDMNTEECTRKLLELLAKICIKYIPKRKTKGKSKIPRERKRLFERMKKLKRSKNKFNSKKKLQLLDTKIKEIENEIISHRKKENTTKEERVIQNIQTKPKMFYNFIRNQENRDTTIGPFKIQGEYIYNGKDICNSLVRQYNNQFSFLENYEKIKDNAFYDINEGPG